MKGKQLLILLLVVAVLGGAWFALSKRDQASWSESSASSGGKIVDFPINDVAKLNIKGPEGEVNLVKKDDVWTVQERANFPASFEQVGGLLRKLWELKTVQEVKVGPSQLGRLELNEKATTVTFQDKDGKTLSALVLGKKHMREGEGNADFGMPGGFAVGRYVKPAAGAKVSLVSETLDEANVKPESWLAKDFIKIEGPKSIAIAGPQTWSVSRDSASATEWKLADAKPEEKTDAGKTSQFANVFATASFVDVQAPDAKLEEPVTTATIETFDGFRYEVKVGKPVGENYPMLFKVSANFPKERTPGKDEKPEDKAKLDGEFAAKQKKLEEKLATEKKFEGRSYLVAKYAVESLLKDRAGLLPDKPAEGAPGAPGAPGAAPGEGLPPGISLPPGVNLPPGVTLPPGAGAPPMPAPKVEAVTPPVQVPPAPKEAAPQPAAPKPTEPAKAPATPAPAAPAAKP